MDARIQQVTINFPTTITKGDSQIINVVLDDYSASNGWTLWLLLNGPVPLTLEATTATDGSFDLNLTSVLTSTLEPSFHQAVMYVTKGVERITLQSTRTEVLPDPTEFAYVNQDFRTFEEKMVDALEALLQRRASNSQLDILRTSIDGKELDRLSPVEIADLRDKYKAKVLSQQGKIPRRILYTFKR